MQDNNSDDFVLQAFINNKHMQVSARCHHVSGVRCSKEPNGIHFYKLNSDEKINIPFEHVKDFAMAVIESYCQFAPEFQGKDVRITVNVSTKE